MTGRAIALVCLLALPSGLAAQPSEEPRPAGLEGLSAVYVMVDPLDDVREDGLAEASVRKMVEDLLAATELRILTQEDLLENAGAETSMHVSIKTSVTSDVNRLYMVELGLRQPVSLARSPGTTFVATTWQASDFGITPRKDLMALNSDIRDLASRFLADFRMANPK